MTMGCSVSPEPSAEVKVATKAMLMDAERRRLPRSLAETEGVLLRQKNTFFHVELEDSNDDSSQDSSDAVGFLDSPVQDSAYSPLPGRFLSVGYRSTNCSPEPPRNSPPRKQTESSIAMPPSLMTRRSSLVSASASVRCHSCPPTAPPSPSTVAFSPSPSLLLNDPISLASPPPPPNPPSVARVVQLPLLQLLPGFGASPSSLGSGKSTVMLRNVPYHESQTGLLRILESRGFRGKYDFFYAPLDFTSGNNLGYCFINLRSSEAVEEFFDTFENLRVNADGWAMKHLAVCWARVQGLGANIEQYRNSPVNEMPLNFRPMLFNEEGDQIPFPSPDHHSTSGVGSSSNARSAGRNPSASMTFHPMRVNFNRNSQTAMTTSPPGPFGRRISTASFPARLQNALAK